MIAAMSDITDAGPRLKAMNDALAEIERLREAIRRLAEQDATLSVQGGNVTVTMDATLTDLERASIVRAIETLEGVEYIEAFATENDATAAATLRGLLERTLTTHTKPAEGSVQDSVT